MFQILININVNMMNFNESRSGFNDLKLDHSFSNFTQADSSSQNDRSFITAIENSIPSGIIIYDETGKQVYVNKSFCDLTGWDRVDLLDKLPPFVYWSPQDTENLDAAFQKILKNNLPEEGFELMFYSKEGKPIQVKILVKSFVQNNNQMFFLANVIDISKQKMFEETLKESQKLLVSSLESHKDTIIFSTDHNYNYLHFNNAHRESMKFAYDKEIRVGMNILECISSDEDRYLVKENLDRSFRGESNSLIQAFGKINQAYYESYFNPILNDKSEIIGSTVLARNITERIQAEQALKDSEKKFKEIVDQISDIIIVFDKEGKIIVWNKGAEQICELKAEDALNRNIIDIEARIIAPPLNDKARIEKIINGILTQETPEAFNRIIDSEIVTLSSRKLLNIQSVVFPITLNEEPFFCTVIRDTTEIKRYEKEFLRISTEKDKLYSMVAQYLYTPFNVFNDFSNLMAEELDNLPIREIQKMARMMSNSASNLYNLLDNLLHWTKMNQGKIPFEPQKVNLKKISQEAVAVLKPNTVSKNFKIDHFIEEGIIVYADVFMLKTIIRNLVSCAIKLSYGEGQIDVFARETQSEVVISVWDNGIGIDSEDLSKLFDISQIHTAIGMAEEKGITLGLIVCKEFVEKHGGRIWAESENGKGNEFKFTMPLTSDQIHNQL